MSEKMNFRRSMRGFRYSMRGYTLMAALLCIAGLLFFVAYNDLLSSPWTSVVNMFQNINTQLLNSHHHHHHHHHHLDLPSLDEIKAKQAQAQAQASSVMTFTTKAPKIAEKKEFFGIMFDAGSTGSRIHVFKFTPGEKGEPFKLVDELFEQVKPGLSSYAKNPQQAAGSLEAMLEKAKKYIPQSEWSSTPMALKATAGLRLLPGTEADAILSEVKKLFQKQPFHIDDESVKIMAGTDEGIFSWFTVNFLAGVIQNPKSTLCVMDLGGGSTQITFIPKEKETLSGAPKDFSQKIDLFGEKADLYSHSYLGLGLMSGRFQIMGGSENLAERNSTPKELKSQCFRKDYSGVWNHGNRKYTVKGPSETAPNFEKCYAEAQAVVKKYQVHQVKEVQGGKDVMVISYYFDRAVDAGLIKETEVEGKPIKVQEFFQAAEKECSKEAVSAGQEFLCMDLSYICALLHEGFSFPRESAIVVRKKVKNVEISWALGATFKLLNSQH